VTATFVAPTTLADVLAAMAAGARPVAGGTDLVVGARQGKKPLPQALVAIHQLDELRAITLTTTGVRIGALVSHEQIIADATIRATYPALADASAIVGSHATRAHGTLGGNIMTASPAMDTGSPLLCFGATAILQSAAGTRSVPMEELWTGPGRTVAEPHELLIAVDLPALAPGTSSCYVRLEYRRQMEIAIVGAGAQVTLVDGLITDARVAMTAVSATIRRVAAAELALIGTSGDRAAADAAGAALSQACTPISDVRGSADYRRAMVHVIARRAIQAAVTRATGGTVPIPASPALHGAS
jgi:CO/xanthine dehydrogenase FAD-binding subunit